MKYVLIIKSNFLQLIVVDHTSHLPFFLKHAHLRIIFHQQAVVVVVNLTPRTQINTCSSHQLKVILHPKAKTPLDQQNFSAWFDHSLKLCVLSLNVIAAL